MECLQEMRRLSGTTTAVVSGNSFKSVSTPGGRSQVPSFRIICWSSHVSHFRRQKSGTITCSISCVWAPILLLWNVMMCVCDKRCENVNIPVHRSRAIATVKWLRYRLTYSPQLSLLITTSNTPTGINLASFPANPEQERFVNKQTNKQTSKYLLLFTCLCLDGEH